MKIKSLAELKRKMVKGCEYVVIQHYVHPEYSGSHRKVNVVQTNGVYAVDPTDMNCKQSTCNGGKGIWMDFGKASNWIFEDGMKCTRCSTYKNTTSKIFTLQFSNQ